MAFVRRFEELAGAPGRGKHATEVICRWGVLNSNGERLLQLNTYGSAQRKDVESVSQTLQLDLKGAMQVVDIILRAFPELGEA